MCHASVSLNNFHALLLKLDLDLVAQAQRAGCPYCGGMLHRADYPRKPWGLDPRARPYYAQRLSLCCDRDGCRRRTTPGTVRFLGRRRYSAGMMILVSVLSQGVAGRRGERLRRALGVSARTMTRWRRWWREVFVTSPFWRTVRGRLGSALALQALPAALLEVFAGRSRRERLLGLLVFLAPLSSSGADYLRGEVHPQTLSM